MKEKSKNEYVRRSQKDCSMSFKMQVINEVERGDVEFLDMLSIAPGDTPHT